MAGYKGNGINPAKFERGQIKIYVVLLPLAIFMLFPLVFNFVNAFKPMEELFLVPPRFYVSNPTFDNFNALMKSARNAGIPLSKYVFNSLIVTVAVCVGGVIISTMAAYALSKMRFKLRGPIFSLNQAALMFVMTAVSIPRYLVISGLHVTNTYWAHILPLIAMPVSLFLIKQFVDQVPDALIEAASIDGATPFMIYRKIVLPLIKPAIATGLILSFQQVWNNLETSNLYVNTDAMKTLTFYTSTLTSLNNTVQGQGVQAAATLIMFIPNLIIFILNQKDVMNTMAHSGIK